MRKPVVILGMALLALIFMGGAVLEAGNITIYDTMGPLGVNQGGEDQEVEPLCGWAQQWDLEGFILNGKMLSMVGGFNFKDGEGVYKPGHIFLDVNGDAAYGNALTGTGGFEAQRLNADFHYEYALVPKFAPGGNTYDVYKLNDASLLMVWAPQNDESNPWQLVLETGELYLSNLPLLYQTGLTDAATGFLGGNHNQLIMDLSWLLEGLSIAHYTMECGNDNLVGKVPIPGTLVLLGSGMLGLACLGWRRSRKEG